MNESIKLGGYTIKAFPLFHDTQICGFWIYHPDMGKMVYITDTEYCKYKFSGLNHMLIESNYSDDTINRDLPNYEHVLTGHFSLEHALDFIKTNDNPMLKEVVLIHLSQENADRETFLERTKQITDKEVYIAKSGLEINLDLIPF